VSGVLVSVQTCLGDRGPLRPLSEARLEPGGIPGDRHFAPGSARELLLIEQETLDQLGLVVGQVRENLTVRGIPIMGLTPGTLLRIGDAEVEITKECLPCEVMEAIRPGLRRELEGRRGMLAKVRREGTVRPGDGVAVRAPAGEPT
jgi:MOSC domain-containing protein YiiM